MRAGEPHLVDTLQRLLAPPPKMPLGRNWQTEQTLHGIPEFAGLVELMLEASDDVLEKMEAEHDGFCLTACWANFNPRAAFRVPHHHPNDFLSGVYYEDARGRGFHHFPRSAPVGGDRRAALSHRQLFNAMERPIPVKNVRLVIFPSWLVHSVRGNMSDEIRNSVSFNVQYTDFEKTIAQPRWKGLPFNRDTLKKV